MLAHETIPSSEASPITLLDGVSHNVCPVCMSVTPSVGTDNLPLPRTPARPRHGQVWKIHESLFTPIAELLEQQMPEDLVDSYSMSSLPSTFRTSNQRPSNDRPCMILDVPEGEDEGFVVLIMGTFRNGNLARMSGAMKFFLVEIDPETSTSFPCAHSSPPWPKSPQYLIAIPHTTLPGHGNGQKRNCLDNPWKHCKDCPRLNPSDPDFTQKNHVKCQTFEFVPAQQDALDNLSMKLLKEWKLSPNKTALTEEFCVSTRCDIRQDVC